jgi:SPX domain protein involved in polyphosphate accumulation
VRLSLDEHMLLLREARPSTNSSTTHSPWCSPLEAAEQLPACDAVRFPYGILEIKLQVGSKYIHIRNYHIYL